MKEDQEQRAREYCNEKYGNNFTYTQWTVDLLTDFAQQELQHYKESQWISVEDRLPESNEAVTVYYKKSWKSMTWQSRIEVIPAKCVFREHGTREWKALKGGNVYQVIGWMPLPTPPKK